MMTDLEVEYVAALKNADASKRALIDVLFAKVRALQVEVLELQLRLEAEQ